MAQPWRGVSELFS